MAAFFDVMLGAAEAIDKKIAEPLFGRRHVAPFIHGAQNVIAGNLLIKRRNQTREAIIADCLKNFVFFHQNDASNYPETGVAPNSRQGLSCDSATAKQVISPSKVFSPLVMARLSLQARSKPLSASANK